MEINHIPEPGAVLTKKYYAIAGMRVAMDDGTDLVYFASDHLSSTSIAISDTGMLLSEQRYKPFGEVRTDVGTILNPGEAGFTDFGFTGQRNLGDIGLMDYSARFYSPLLGRFIQPDTIIPNPGDSQAWNRYSYTSNNPIRFMDPTGHIAEGECPFHDPGCDGPPPPPDCSQNPEVCLANNRNSKHIKGDEHDSPPCNPKETHCVTVVDAVVTRETFDEGNGMPSYAKGPAWWITLINFLIAVTSSSKPSANDILREEQLRDSPNVRAILEYHINGAENLQFDVLSITNNGDYNIHVDYIKVTSM